MEGSKSSTKKTATKTMKVSGSTSKPRKPTQSSVGAPSQHNQASRKGKRAWRKNIDIGEVEEGLEGLRAEERVIGTTLQKTQDSDLFAIDVKGDDQIRKALPRYSKAELSSTKILAQRSAVPAVFSRPTSSTSNKRKSGLSYEDKARLLRIGKRPRKGPFNSIVDPTEFGAGSAIIGLSEAVKNSGDYDPWVSIEEEELEDGMETVQKKPVKPPTFAHPRDKIEVAAIVEPHQGTSYNPPAEAHQELLLKAYEIEQRRLRAAEKDAETTARFQNAQQDVEVADIGVASGMKVDNLVAEEVEGETEDGEERVQKKMPARKTKAQRNKAARHLAEKRALAGKAANKRMLATISEVKMMRRSRDQILTAREKALAQKQLELREKLKKGLAGQRLGKHKVPEGQVDVQLGEELSESLRGLKPEGNLFRDRFLSLQSRALIEPRVPVLPKKRRNKMIEYEKHAWKRFE